MRDFKKNYKKFHVQENIQKHYLPATYYSEPQSKNNVQWPIVELSQILNSNRNLLTEFQQNTTEQFH